MPTTEYDALLDLIAAHPGADRDEIHDPRATPIAPMLTLSTTASMTLAREDALEANEHYWVMRTGRFARPSTIIR